MLGNAKPLQSRRAVPPIRKHYAPKYTIIAQILSRCKPSTSQVHLQAADNTNAFIYRLKIWSHKHHEILSSNISKEKHTKNSYCILVRFSSIFIIWDTMRLCIIQILYFRYFTIQLYKDHEHPFQILPLYYKKDNRNFFPASFTKKIDESERILQNDTHARSFPVFHDLSIYSQGIEGLTTEAPMYW